MEITERKSILAQLAKTGILETSDKDPVFKALNEEAKSIGDALAIETDYDNISNQIELLKVISYRVPEKAFTIITEFLERLNNIELTYKEVLGFSVEEIKRFHNKISLTVKLLEFLKHLRYYRPDDALGIFFEYSIVYEDEIKKEAYRCLKAFADFDLDVFYSDGENWRGLGAQPQQKSINLIESFNVEEKRKYLLAIVSMCESFLSPTISGTISDYSTITFRTGAIPAIDEIRLVRTKAISILKELYFLAKVAKEKKQIILALQIATHTPGMTA